MGLKIDLHTHTRLHSSCSQIEPAALVRQAVRAGLDGVAITEHHYQWRPQEVAELLENAGEAHFLVMAGFEYASSQGDMLVFGLTIEQADEFRPGMPPEDAVHRVHELGGVCIAAHPTRAGMGYDDRIATLPFDAIEVASVNLQEHEQRLAAQLAANIGLRPLAASDAHRVADVGKYATEFLDPLHSVADLRNAIKNGRFRPVTDTTPRSR